MTTNPTTPFPSNLPPYRNLHVPRPGNQCFNTCHVWRSPLFLGFRTVATVVGGWVWKSLELEGVRVVAVNPYPPPAFFCREEYPLLLWDSSAPDRHHSMPSAL